MSYDKGARGEIELGEEMRKRGYFWIRAPGSGTADRELPDLIAGNAEKYYVFEVKRWSNDFDRRYLKAYEVEELYRFAEGFGAVPKIAIRYDYGDWALFDKEDIEKTTKGNYRVDKFKFVEEKGLDAVIGNEK